MNHAQMVLTGILPARRDNLHFAMGELQDDHFVQPNELTVWKLVTQYYEQTGGLLTPEILTDILSRRGADPAKTLAIEELMREATDQEIRDDQFRYAIRALRDMREQQRTGEAIALSFEILERGWTDPATRKEWQGHADARTRLYEDLGQIDRLRSTESAPEGDLRLETDELFELYVKTKTATDPPGIYTGIPSVDRATGGHAPGDLALYCAYTNQGKSMLAAQLAWHASVIQGKNVFLSTSETVRAQYMRRIVARHTRQPQFGCPDGLDTNQMKRGTLSAQDEEIYRAALDDLSTNPNYGKLHIAQLPRDATLSFLEARMKRQQQLWSIDLAICDYLNLLKPSVRRQKAQEETNELIKDAKLLATSFNDGEGIPFISPWQMSQAAYKTAAGDDGRGGTGRYTLANLAETSEAEKSSDFIGAILRFADTPKKAQFQLLKLRDDAVPPPIELTVDYRNAYLGEEEDEDWDADDEEGFGL